MRRAATIFLALAVCISAQAALFKNTTSQKIAVYAYDTSGGAAKTGDAANIYAQISKDGGAAASTNDTNPTELSASLVAGVYIFDMTTAETNAEMIVLSATSSTANILLEPVIIFTQPVYNDLSAAQVNAEVDTGISDAFTFTGADVHATLDSETVTVGTNNDKTGYALSTATSEFQADVSGLALEANVAGHVTTSLNSYDPPTRAELTSDIAGLNDITAASVWAVGARTLTTATSEFMADVSGLFTSANGAILDASVDGLEDTSAPSAATVADAVWDEAITGHAGAGSTGALVDWIRDVLEGDHVLDMTGTPWTAQITIKSDTSTVLVEKELYDTSGAAVTDTESAIKNRTEP